MANSVMGDISEGLDCSVCLEIPDAEVFECDNGHWLCNKCYFQVAPALCPECRTELDRDNPRRNRAIERVIKGLSVDCAFESKGCFRKLTRGSAQGHQAECIFNFDKFGQFVNLCKSIGYPNCGFKFNNGNPIDAVEHFVSKHGCILTTSEKFQMKLTSFKESAKAGGSGFHFWTPIIADLKERKCYLWTMVVLNKVDASFTWVSMFIPYPSNEHRESSPVEVEYSVKTMASLPCTVWIGRPMSLKEAHEMLPKPVGFVNYSPLFVQGCSNEGDLLIDCIVRRHGVTVPTGREEKYICTRNEKSFPVVENIKLKNSKVPVRFDRVGGSSAAISFRDKLEKDCVSNRSNLLPLLHNLFGSGQPAGLKGKDVKWLKTDLIFVIAEYGSVEALEYLIGEGVNFNVVDKVGIPLLCYTMFDKNKKIGLGKAKLLVNSGKADVEVLSDKDWSVLHYAAKNGSNEAVEYFIREGCDVDDQTNGGWTPLHFVVSYISEEEGLKIVKSLLEKGADLSVKNNNGSGGLFGRFKRKN